MLTIGGRCPCQLRPWVPNVTPGGVVCSSLLLTSVVDTITKQFDKLYQVVAGGGPASRLADLGCAVSVAVSLLEMIGGGRLIMRTHDTFNKTVLAGVGTPQCV